MELDYVKLGDGLEYIKELPDSSVDLILTDPPYAIQNTNAGGGSMNANKKLDKYLSQLDNANISSGYDIVTYGEEFIRVLKKINLYIWCNKLQIPDYFDFYVNKHNCTFDIICWHKTNPLPTYANKYLSDTEYCLYFRKGGDCFPQSYEDAKTYYLAPLNQKDKKLYGHPTIKPLDLTERLIRNSTKENQIVLDPFLGSGTTAVASKRMNRHYIGYEINEDFYNTALGRINNAEPVYKDRTKSSYNTLF